MSSVLRVAVSNVRMPRSHRDDVEIAALGDVLGGHQPFLDRGVHPALDQHRFAGRSDRLEQREVLHVAGADLQHVGVAGDHVDVVRAHHLGDNRKPDLVAHIGKDLQPTLAQALEGVGRGARLERAAAQQRGAGGLGHPRRRMCLVRRLDGARPGDQRHGLRADGHSPDLHDRPLRMLLANDQLVLGRDSRHPAYPGQPVQVQRRELLDVADQSDDHPADSTADERLAAGRLHQRDERVDIPRRGVRGHHDNHVINVLSSSSRRDWSDRLAGERLGRNPAAPRR
jgi:hypothetical protein